MDPGSRLGPYEIVSRIGAGGMGEVFKARDTRLDRSVAIKVLPAELAHNAQLRLRFDREARTISQLNHPNICTLYDVGDDYLVMELLEGETLADVAARGPMPLEDVFRYGAQIAEGIHRAHRAGIIHRDLKPGNVMITSTGAKLLDFGLAKHAELAVQSESAGLATEHKPLTQEGTLLGTFQYMAPEQLEGLEADARTDIFALGAVLYEMATGKRAFDGKTRTSLIAAIVKDDPRPVSELRPVTPAGLEHVIARCLAKDPERRWQSAQDVAEELRWIGGSSQAAATMSSAARARRRPLMVAVAVAPWILLAALAAWQFRPVRRPASVTSILPPAGMSYEFESSAPILSPDGRTLAFIAADAAGRSQMYLRRLGNETAKPVPGTDGADYPFWSPDGSMIGFFSAGKLKVIAASGGPSQIVADAPNARGGAWSSDGAIVFNADFRDGLFSVPARGGAPKRLTKIAPGEISHRWPVVLPDGKHVLFLAQRGEGGSESDTSSIDVVSVKDGARREVVQANSSPLYSPSGHLLYWRDKTLFCHPFDVKKQTLTGTAVPLADEVSYSGTEAAIASVSAQGTLVYQAHGSLGKSRLMAADRTGVMSLTVAPVGGYLGLALSHDGRKLVVTISDRGDDLRVFDVTRGTVTRLTFDSGDETSPVWSPDNSKIAFASNRKDGGDVYVIPATGGKEEPVWVSAGDTAPLDWSHDGDSLLMQVVDGKSGLDLWIYSLSQRRAQPWLQTPFNEQKAVFSRDGRWIAYASDESGRMEVYVQSRDRTTKWQISRDGGTEPQWRADGRELFYLRDDEATGAPAPSGAGSEDSAAIYSVDVTGENFEAAAPVRLFKFRARVSADRPDSSYAVAPDGKTIYLRTPASNTDSPLTLVQNWTELLRRP